MILIAWEIAVSQRGQGMHLSSRTSPPIKESRNARGPSTATTTRDRLRTMWPSEAQ